MSAKSTVDSLIEKLGNVAIGSETDEINLPSRLPLTTTVIRSITNPKASVDDDDLPDVVLINSLSQLDEFKTLVIGKTILAVDAEGVNLSRFGELTVVSVGILIRKRATRVFLFDMIQKNETLRVAQLAELKRLMEDVNIEKIIHDCRQDSDALFVQYQIRLQNVFDSSVFHCKIQRNERKVNLNKALKHYECALNTHRDEINDLYRSNPNFWRTRPFTPFMIEYASKDVASLFDLREKLIAKMNSTMPTRSSAIYEASQAAIDEYRGMVFTGTISVPKSKAGKVIGKGGSGIQAIEDASGAKVSHSDGHGCFSLLAPTQKALDKAKSMINQKTRDHVDYDYYD